ncbi:predicted protein [Naegleria gruberi]|uniref:Predicted protein n=1 Tax=Naegleria gruberi TaxID=5762 RepID=D2W5V9_NAEGR|nr:uncharacterized protein NAEGRDRAFT_76803 [Naegleria gruberi]EFC35544.1 predicted protein [Naegleria gruberi]|eukprot:XP_002668288.1 predicted protein [Naegleria gruberi strain NEG-M]
MTSLNKIFYSLKHNYDFILFNQPFYKSWFVKPAWNKIPLIKSQLSSYDWIIWIDSDALVLLHQVDLDQIIEESLKRDPNKNGEINLIISYDRNGLNSGIMAIRNCKWSHQILNNVLSWKYFLYSMHWYAEQTPLVMELEHGKSQNVRVALKSFLNSYMYDYKEGKSFIFHLAGCNKYEGNLCASIMRNFYENWRERNVTTVEDRELLRKTEIIYDGVSGGGS